MIVVPDLLQGEGADLTAKTFVARRGFGVTEIGGSRDNKINTVLDHPDIPHLGKQHPTLSRLYCVGIGVEFQEPSIAKVMCSYDIPKVDQGDLPEGTTDAVADPPDDPGGAAQIDQGTIEVGASTSMVTTKLDASGEVMEVSHQTLSEEWPTDAQGNQVEGPPVITLKEVIQPVTAEVTRPSTVLRMRRLEKGSPDAKSRSNVGRVNSLPIGGDPANTWLCTRIDGVSNDGGDTYIVAYEFQRNEDGWFFEADWIDPETGAPVPEEDINTGRETIAFDVYRKADFRQLSIGFSGAIGGIDPTVSRRSARSANRLILRNFAKNAPSGDQLFLTV